MPSVTIITPTYNRRRQLERAIQSVQRQTLSDYEHIVIDDGSDDDTYSYLQACGDPRIRCLRFTSRRGANAARNAGIASARAEVVAFLDSDDEFLPHRLERIVERLIVRSDLQLLISSFRTLKHGRLHDSINPAVELTGPEFERVLMTHGVYIAGSAITVRRQLLQDAGGFEPSLQRMQDRELLLRLSTRCGVLLLSDVDWIKHHSPDSISGPRDGYMTSLGALLERHPDLAERHSDLVDYHIARHILSDLLQGQWSRAWRSCAANRRSPALGRTAWQLIAGYRTGAAERRALAQELKRRAGVAAKEHHECVLPQEGPRRRAA